MIPLIPNLITFSRLIFLYQIILLLPQFPFYKKKIIALYILGVCTDALDGYVAKKFDMESEFGKFFDGFVDYIYGAVLVIFLYKYVLIDKIIFFPFLIIIVRDSIRNLIRLKNFNKVESKDRAASYSGKISRVLQNIVLVLVLLTTSKNILLCNQVLINISMILSIYSFINYL